MKSMEVFSELRKEGTCCCVMVRLQVSWLPAVRAVTQLRNRLVQVSDNKFLRILVLLPIRQGLTFAHYVLNLVLSLLVHKLSLLLWLSQASHVVQGSKSQSMQCINWFWPLGWKQVFSLRACRLIHLESMTKSTTGMVTAVRCEQNKW